MFELIHAIPFTFAALFPVLNPLGGAITFLTLTMGLSEAAHAKLARQVSVNVFILLLVVLLSGSWILQFFGITIPVVQIGGGLVVAYIGWSRLNQPMSDIMGNNAVNDESAASNIAFFPLTMPITAGPGSIAVTLTVGAHQMGNSFASMLMGEIGAIVGIILASASVFFCYRYANRMTHALKPTGIQIVVRLSSFINMCIGIQIICHGIAGLVPPTW